MSVMNVEKLSLRSLMSVHIREFTQVRNLTHVIYVGNHLPIIQPSGYIREFILE
jgi:hypothetical protein